MDLTAFKILLFLLSPVFLALTERFSLCLVLVTSPDKLEMFDCDFDFFSATLADVVTEKPRLSCEPTNGLSENEDVLEFIAELCNIFLLEPLSRGSILESIPEMQ